MNGSAENGAAGSASAFDLVVRGRLLLPGQPLTSGSVAVIDGSVAAVTLGDAELDAEVVIDAGDALVLPGVVDVHVHTRSAATEGIERATRAAAAGGVTTIVDMPYDADGMIAGLDAFEAKAADVEREAVVDAALWATVPPSGPITEVDALRRAGAAAFKLSTFDTDPRRFPRIDDAQLLAAFAAIAKTDGLVGVHCENDEIVRAGIAAERAAGHHDGPAHARSRPPLAEIEAIGRCLELARATGVRLHLCHVTLGRGIELADRARAARVDVTAETCPHYLLLDEYELTRQGATAKINPPLRAPSEVGALWQALAAGTCDLVASDHVGWPVERKRGDDIFAVAAGAPGLELMLPLMHDAIVARGLPPALLVHALCEAPARRFGLWPRKGSLLPGADADLVVLDPDERWTIDPARLTTACGWSPYEGRELHGRVRLVLLRGRQVYADGAVVGAAGGGRFVGANGIATREVAHV
ncbi:L-hydantoinase [Baekduia alba]|uniref:dihydroorotase n=1 Tax=Baekduia alba TaxID=2997333 RepID=UPI002341784B|nr:amidohydrolase family protein [Baekduia alba]WCB91532.1 L-hydantoinase [Baekduia alba]